MNFARRPLLALCTALLACVAWHEARACACCTSTGERMDLAMPLTSSYVDELAHLQFEPTAQLFLGEAEPDMVKGIKTPAASYHLQAAWLKDNLVFAFRDQADRTGTLALARPKTISIFHVDPREGTPPPSCGPSLYKEWRLTAKAAGTGIFTPGLGAAQILTLVLQGRGNNCTSANDFTHWMLVMWGPKTKYHFFGGLQTSR